MPNEFGRSFEAAEVQLQALLAWLVADAEGLRDVAARLLCAVREVILAQRQLPHGLLQPYPAELLGAGPAEPGAWLLVGHRGEGGPACMDFPSKAGKAQAHAWV